MKLEGMTWNFLGDSITEGVGTTADKNRYFELIKEQYGLNEVNGYGISGTRLAKQIEKSSEPSFDIYFASRINSMKDADGVVVFGGTNDFGHGDAPIGSFSDRTPDTFYGACHDLYTKLLQKYPGKPVVVMTPLHRTEENDIRIKHGVHVDLASYVTIIKEVAAYYSIPVCDMFADPFAHPANPESMEKLIPDGIHPNDAGHVCIADKLGRFLSLL